MTLPDSSFLYARGDKQLFPYKDSVGRIDRELVDATLEAISASNLSAPVKANLMTNAKAIAKRTAEAELQSYIREGVGNALPAGGQPKETDMGIEAYKRLEEALVPTLLKLLGLEVGVAKQRLATANVEQPIVPKEEPVAESMQESYHLPAEALSEAASWGQGEERILRNCTFIAAGLNVPKTRRWPAELLEANIDSFDGSLCFIDHPAEGAPRSLRALAGHTRNPHFDKATNSVVGDIVLLDDNEAADYVVSVFGNETVRNSGAVGLSVLWEGGTFEADFEEQGDRMIQVPRELSGKCQVDFVANPTAFGSVGKV